MRKDKTFAAQPHLWAIATVYKVRIQIYSTTNEYPTINPIGQDCQYALYLQYYPEGIHYASLIPISTNNDNSNISPTKPPQLPILQDIQQQQILLLSTEQLHHIISFSANLAAINYQ